MAIEALEKEMDVFVDDRSWEWHREKKEGWKLEEGVLKVAAAEGSIWGDFGKRKPAANTLLIYTNEGSELNVGVKVKNACKAYGEQGGVLLWKDVDNWFKVVVEGIKDGTVALVVAAQTDGKPAVLLKEAIENLTSVLIHIVISPQDDTIQVNEFPLWKNASSTWPPLKAFDYIGLMAHGGDGTRWIEFSDLSIEKGYTSI